MEEKVFKYVIYLIFIILTARLFYLQVIKYEENKEKSMKNIIKEIEIPAVRGRIFDRNGKIIASSRIGYEAIIEDTIIKEDIDIKEIIKLEESGKKFYIIGKPYRLYPYGNIYSHLIGWTSKVSKEELLNGIYSLGDRIGRCGIEKIYEEILKGKDGISFRLVDARGNILWEEVRPPILPQKGKDITISCDIDLGIYIDSLFLPYKKGGVIVLNIKNGEILSLYSKPSFDLNILSGMVKEEKWNEIKNDTLNPILSRPISGLYAPGSIFKIFTALLGLELGVIDTNEVIHCNGEYKFGNRTFKDWKKEGHGKVNFKKAVEVSCDVYFYEMARRIGLKRFLKKLQESKIEEKKGVDLFGEKEGFLPDLDFYYKKYGPYGFSEGNVLNLGIGQGEILLTPMQIAVFVSQVANEGKIIKPHIIKKIEGEEVIIKDTLFLPFDKEIIRIVKNALFYVCQGENGTGRSASMKEWNIAGKTGTSQNPFGKDHAFFCGFAPFEDPIFCVLVFVENAGMGGEVAAPIAGKIFKYIYKKWQKGIYF
ncbi:MAG: penicillin-binding transpeptidase domain-containing protein [candidate division WOR-3 bacterium]